MKLETRWFRTLVVQAVVLALPAVAVAGPPLLCFPMTIGTATSLPWGPGTGWNTPASDYDRSRLVADTVGLLAPGTPVIVRMETLRRATIYASTDAARAAGLLDALRARVATSAPLATFDLGYTIEVMRQMQFATREKLPVPTDDGKTLVDAALSMRGDTAALHYAAALMRADSGRNDAHAHLEAAVAGASRDAHLARTIEAHADLWGHRLSAARASATR